MGKGEVINFSFLLVVKKLSQLIHINNRLSGNCIPKLQSTHSNKWNANKKSPIDKSRGLNQNF